MAENIQINLTAEDLKRILRREKISKEFKSIRIQLAAGKEAIEETLDVIADLIDQVKESGANSMH